MITHDEHEQHDHDQESHDHDHDHDHEHGAVQDAHENQLVTDSKKAAVAAAEEKIFVFQGTEEERLAAEKMIQPIDAIIETLKLCAERGWKLRFILKSGQILERMFITGTDWNKSYIALERVGERHLAPTLIHIPDIAHVTPIWN